jgi:hypothetical protein
MEELRIRDAYPGSKVRRDKSLDPNPQQKIRVFNPKNVYQVFKNNVQEVYSGSRIPNLDFSPSGTALHHPHVDTHLQVRA